MAHLPRPLLGAWFVRLLLLSVGAGAVFALFWPSRTVLLVALAVATVDGMVVGQRLAKGSLPRPEQPS